MTSAFAATTPGADGTTIDLGAMGGEVRARRVSSDSMRATTGATRRSIGADDGLTMRR